MYFYLALLILYSLGEKPKTIKIGSYLSLTGSYSQLFEAYQGVKFYVDYMNEQGGIPIGSEKIPIEWIVYDDKSNATLASEYLRKLILQDQVDFIIGGHTSFMDSSARICDSYEMVNIQCCTGPPSYYKQGFKWAWGVHLSSDDYPKLFIKTMTLQSVKTTAIIYNDYVGFTLSTCASAKVYSQQSGLTVKAYYSYSGMYYSNNTDETTRLKSMVEIMEKVKLLNPESLIICSLYPDGIIAAKAIIQTKINVKALFMTVAPTSPSFITDIGLYAEYIFSPLQWHYSLNYIDPYLVDSQTYAKNFKSKFGDLPTYTAASGTAAAIILHHAIVTSGTTNRTNIKQTLMELRREFFFGQIAFNGFQQNFGGLPPTIQIIDGAQASVLPTEVAQRNPVVPIPDWTNRDKCPYMVTQQLKCIAEINQIKPSSKSESTFWWIIIVVVLGILLCTGVSLAIAYVVHKSSIRGRVLSSVPKGSEMAMIFTDIQCSTNLWSQYPSEMKEALAIHHQIMRTTINLCNGYEVKTIGDSFMATFHNCSDALKFCCQVQHLLLNSEWPATLLNDDNCKRVIDIDYGVIWNGLRVRIGVNCGEADLEYDNRTNKVDYYGQMVNLSSRLESLAYGGQVLVTEDVYYKDTTNYTYKYLGEYSFKGVNGKRRVYQLTTIEGREFPPQVYREDTTNNDVGTCSKCLRPCRNCNGTSKSLNKIRSASSILSGPTTSRLNNSTVLVMPNTSASFNNSMSKNLSSVIARN